MKFPCISAAKIDNLARNFTFYGNIFDALNFVRLVGDFISRILIEA